MKIIFTCGSGGPNYDWAGASFDKGIGGSESCLIRLAEEFAAKGHEVIVYNRCGSLRGKYKGVMYVEHIWANRMPRADLLISWRNWYLLFPPACGGHDHGAKWHWTHDIPVGAHHPCQEECERDHENALQTIDKIVYLNNYHQSLSSSFWPGDKSCIFPVGVEFDTSLVEDRDRLRCVTFYHPDRGLDVLRGFWPVIQRAVPGATLQSYWWEPEHFRPAVEEYGILPMQRLSQKDLFRECLKSGIMPYPSTFGPEISPVSTILAQVGGCYPVVVLQGGMVDTCKYVCAVPRGEFIDSMVSALQVSARGGLERDRELMMSWGRETFNWPSVASCWIDAWEKSNGR